MSLTRDGYTKMSSRQAVRGTLLGGVTWLRLDWSIFYLGEGGCILLKLLQPTCLLSIFFLLCTSQLALLPLLVGDLCGLLLISVCVSSVYHGFAHNDVQGILFLFAELGINIMYARTCFSFRHKKENTINMA